VHQRGIFKLLKVAAIVSTLAVADTFWWSNIVPTFEVYFLSFYSAENTTATIQGM